MNKENLKVNGSGVSDPTAYAVIKKDWIEKRFHDLINHIFYICNMAGFYVEGRICLVDKKTGRKFD